MRRKEKIMKTISKKMSLLEKLSYGAGNMGICLATTAITAFVMYFYMDVIGIGLIQVGTIMLIGGIADAISDAVMGVIVDHTNTRWGKCRPYLLFGAIPMAVFCFFVFRVPDASATVKYIYALVTYVLYILSYTAVLIPQNVLITAITDDQKDRLATNMFGTLGTNFGQLIPNALALTLVAVLGGGDEYSGYGKTILIFVVIGAALIFMDGKNTRERMNMIGAQKIGIVDTLQSMKNVPWIICTVTTLLVIASVVIKSSTTVYFAVNVLNSPGIASTLLSIANVIGIPVTLIIPFIAGKIGKRNLVWTGCIFGFIGSVGVHFFKESILMVIVMSSLASIGVAFINGIIYVMCAESVDYGEWKHKVRVQGFLMAFIGFAVKVSNSFVSMISTAIMNAGGYVGGSETQTASAVNAIEFCYVGIPGILFVVIFIVNIFYKLDKMYPQIQTELELRRAAIDQ